MALNINYFLFFYAELLYKYIAQTRRGYVLCNKQVSMPKMKFFTFLRQKRTYLWWTQKHNVISKFLVDRFSVVLYFLLCRSRYLVINIIHFILHKLLKILQKYFFFKTLHSLKPKKINDRSSAFSISYI